MKREQYEEFKQQIRNFFKTYITEIQSIGVENCTDIMIKKGMETKADSSPQYHEDGRLLNQNRGLKNILNMGLEM